jgi:HEAT repeat protein
VEKVPGPEATSTLVGVLESLPSEHQVLMLRALGIRGDATAAPAVAKAAGSEDQDVRIAALEALGSVGEPASLAVLIRAAATGGREQEVARRSLLLLPGRETDDRLMQAMSDGTDAERIEVIRALAGRGVSAAVGGLFQAAGDQNAEVAQAAITALGTLAAPMTPRAGPIGRFGPRTPADDGRGRSRRESIPATGRPGPMRRRGARNSSNQHPRTLGPR